MNKEQGYYLKNVLGLENVVWPEMPEGSTSDYEIIGEGEEFLFIGHCQNKAEQELFQKILGAMKLDFSRSCFLILPKGYQDFESLESDLEQFAESKKISFGEFPLENVTAIASLSEMMNTPDKKKSAWKILQGMLATFLLLFSLSSPASVKTLTPASCVVQMDLTSVVGPATLDLLDRSLVRAHEKNCGALFVRINTPGGNLQTTRIIVERIVNAPIPILCLVTPSGGHAGSAGAIILQACHLNGALEATNIGAATPVTLGEEMGKDMRNKVVSDTVSMLDGLTELRGRNKQFGRDIVEKGSAVSAAEAFKIKAIDFTGNRDLEFLQFVDQKTVKLTAGKTAVVSPGEVLNQEQDLRFKLLDLVTHPQVAYLIFMGSIALLYFEITHAGMILPGVIGAFGLITSLISFHMLEVQWGGLALLVLGLALMVAELFVTSFGVLGIGGLISFVAGSLFLFDPSAGSLPLSTILPTAFGLSGIMMLVGWLALRAQRTVMSNKSMVGEQGLITRLEDDLGHMGKLEYKGEIWNFESPQSLKTGDRVVVQSMNGLVLTVVRKS